MNSKILPERHKHTDVNERKEKDRIKQGVCRVCHGTLHGKTLRVKMTQEEKAKARLDPKGFRHVRHKYDLLNDKGLCISCDNKRRQNQ